MTQTRIVANVSVEPSHHHILPYVSIRLTVDGAGETVAFPFRASFPGDTPLALAGRLLRSASLQSVSETSFEGTFASDVASDVTDEIHDAIGRENRETGMRIEMIRAGEREAHVINDIRRGDGDQALSLARERFGKRGAAFVARGIVAAAQRLDEDVPSYRIVDHPVSGPFVFRPHVTQSSTRRPRIRIDWLPLFSLSEFEVLTAAREAFEVPAKDWD